MPILHTTACTKAGITAKQLKAIGLALFRGESINTAAKAGTMRKGRLMPLIWQSLDIAENMPRKKRCKRSVESRSPVQGMGEGAKCLTFSPVPAVGAERVSRSLAGCGPLAESPVQECRKFNLLLRGCSRVHACALTFSKFARLTRKSRRTRWLEQSCLQHRS